MMKTGQGVSSRQDQTGEYVHVLVRAWLLDMSPKPPGFADEHVFVSLFLLDDGVGDDWWRRESLLKRDWVLTEEENGFMYGLDSLLLPP